MNDRTTNLAGNPAVTACGQSQCSARVWQLQAQVAVDLLDAAHEAFPKCVEGEPAREVLRCVSEKLDALLGELKASADAQSGPSTPPPAMAAPVAPVIASSEREFVLTELLCELEPLLSSALKLLPDDRSEDNNAILKVGLLRSKKLATGCLRVLDDRDPLEQIERDLDLQVRGRA